MQIAIDASRTTLARVTGTERYALELIRAIIELNTEHRITLYFRDAPPADLLPESDLVRQRVIPFARVWTHLRFAAALWQDRPDLTFVPAHTLPFAFPGKAVVTAHDLGYLHFPQAHPWRSRFYLDLTTRYSVRRAACVLADSQATADDLSRFYGVSPYKTRVVYPGVDPPLRRHHDLRQRYGLPQRYLVFIGTLQPRKNIAGLVEAYQQYRQLTQDPVGLVLAGGQGWLFDPAWVQRREGVVMTGYIDEADKGDLLAGAEALVFPSLYEGFGFPVIEAMHCGTPVIASNTSSLPELVGDAGILVNPNDPPEIAAGIQKLMEDRTLRELLIARGRQQAQKFAWQEAARATLSIFEDAIK